MIMSQMPKSNDAEVKKINDKIASNSSEALTYNNRLNQAKDLAN